MTAASGAADRARPPGPAAAPSPIGHEFDPYTYGDQVFCAHVEVRDDGYGKVSKTCGRPADEHPAEVDKATSPLSDMSTNPQVNEAASR